MWVKIEEQRNSSIYIRPDTIRRVSPTARSVWRKTIFVKPEDKVKEHLVKNVIDCVAETITVMAITTYDKSGKVISSGAIETTKQDADPVTPDSLSETIMNAVCSAGDSEDEQAPRPVPQRRARSRRPDLTLRPSRSEADHSSTHRNGRSGYA
ncbi:surface-adhesin E family protein [Sphingomonas sp. MMS24-JH45]